MIHYLEIFSLFIFAIVYLVFSVKNLLRLRVFKSQQVMIFLSVLAFGVILVGEVFLITDKMDVFVFEKVLKACLGLCFGIYLALVSLIAVQEENSKKIQILWRIPIIGLLACSYFQFKYVKIILVGYIVIMLMVCFKQREHLRYLFVKVVPFAFLGVFILFLNPYSVLHINAFALCCLWISSSLLNLANINGLIRSKVVAE